MKKVQEQLIRAYNTIDEKITFELEFYADQASRAVDLKAMLEDRATASNWFTMIDHILV